MKMIISRHDTEHTWLIELMSQMTYSVSLRYQLLYSFLVALAILAIHVINNRLHRICDDAAPTTHLDQEDVLASEPDTPESPRHVVTTDISSPIRESSRRNSSSRGRRRIRASPAITHKPCMHE